MPKKLPSKINKKAKPRKKITRNPRFKSLIISLLVIIFGASFLFFNYYQRQKQQPVETNSFSLEEVAQHATAEDCWMAIEGRVYDVTLYIAEQVHPGGKAMNKGCGKDATEMWNNIGKETKRPHSAEAMSLLQNFYIGDLN
ncbi:MAG: cytochrome b5 domain-containing protein [Patescibacteria group bacterium]